MTFMKQWLPRSRVGGHQGGFQASILIFWTSIHYLRKKEPTKKIGQTRHMPLHQASQISLVIYFTLIHRA